MFSIYEDIIENKTGCNPSAGSKHNSWNIFHTQEKSFDVMSLEWKKGLITLDTKWK